MTVKQIKNFLNGYRRTAERIRRLEDQIAELREKATSMSVRIDGIHVQTGGHNDPFSRIVCMYIDKGEELAARLEIERSYRAGVNDVIGSLGESERDIFEMRYVFGHTWESIARSVGYTVRQVHRNHGRALEKLSKTLPANVDNFGE